MPDGGKRREWSKELCRPGRAIVCVLPRGAARPVLEALAKEKGITAASLHSARGAAFAGRARRSGMGREVEKDILTAFAPEERADEIFAYLYERAGIAASPQAFLYMEKTGAAVV